MAKLILSVDGEVAGTHFIDSVDGEVAGTHFIDASRFTIGSLPDSSLQLARPGVSRIHAAIFTVGNDDILEDLGSTNGTLVNGRKIARHILQHDDVIEIAGCQIRYRSQKAASGPSLDRTMVIKGLAPELAEQSPARAGLERVGAKRAAQAREGGRLGLAKMTRGPQAGREIELTRVLRTFGQPGVQVAVVNRRPHGYFITHVEGRKPALLNGRPIGGDPQPLAPNDVVSVGDEAFQFQLK